MAQSFDRQGAALASFFFKRGGGDLARSRKVISTIAFQLGIRSRLLGRRSDSYLKMFLPDE